LVRGLKGVPVFKKGLILAKRLIKEGGRNLGGVRRNLGILREEGIFLGGPLERKGNVF